MPLFRLRHFILYQAPHSRALVPTCGALVSSLMHFYGSCLSFQVWTQKKVWEGFVRCCQRTKPQSFQVLLQLPPEQLKDVFMICPDVREPLLGHINSLTDVQVCMWKHIIECRNYMVLLTLSFLLQAKPHSSVGTVADLRTGGRWLDPRLSHYSFQELMIVVVTGFTPLSPLSIVSTMVMWENCQWLGKNIVWCTG